MFTKQSIGHKNIENNSLLDLHFKECLSLLIDACQCAFVQIKLSSSEQHWDKFQSDSNYTTSINISKLHHLLESYKSLEFCDLDNHEEFKEDDVTINNEPVKYCAAMPLITIEGDTIGTLSVINIPSEELNTHQLSLFKFIAKDIVTQITLSDKKHELIKLKVQQQMTNNDFDEFFHMATHDLKSPLNAIKNISAWIEEDLNGNTAIDSKYFPMLKNSIRRMHILLRDLNAYSKIGKNDGLYESFTLKTIVDKCCSQLNTTKTFNITIDDCELTLPITPLMLVLNNLISNAVNHHPLENVNIHIHGISDNQSYHICVSDDGEGIPVQFQKKIFMPFQSLKSKDEMETSGLGLAMIKKALIPYSGEIFVESEVTLGSKFTIVWPKKSDHQ